MRNYKKFGLSLLVFGLVLVGGFAIPASKAHADAINTATQAGATTSTQFTAFKGVPVYRLLVTNSGGVDDTITSLSPTPSGSVVDTHIRLHFYHDANDNGIVDEEDTDLGVSALIAVDDTKQTFNIADVTVPANGYASILITADGSGLANSNFFILSFPAAVDITTTTPITGGAPGAGSTLTVTNTSPSLTIADGPNNHGPHTATPNQTGVVVKQLSITTAAAGTADSIVSLAMTPDGSEDATNVAATKFYIDLGTPGVIDGDGSDILLSTTPTTYSINGIETFTFLSPFQIAGGSSVKILYTYDLGAGVVGGRTLTAQLVDLGDAVAGSGVPVATNDSTVSDTITIATTAIITVSSAKITGPNQITVGFNPGAGTMSTAPITAFGAGALVLTSGSGGARTIDSLVSLSGNTAVYTFDGATVALNETAVLTFTTPTDITDTGANTFDAVHDSPLSIADGQAPVVTSVVITAGAYKIGSVIPVAITTSADTDIYTAGAITINGHTMGSFTSAGSYIYTGTHTVVSGDVDRASVGVIPVSVVLTDTSNFYNSNVAYTAAPTSGGTVTIDANAPTASTPLPTLQTLKGGTVSTSNVGSTEAGNIYLVLHGTSATTQTEINTAVTAHNAFLGCVSIGATTCYVTPDASLNDGLYDVVAVDTAGNVSAAFGGWLTVDNTAPATPTATPDAGTYTTTQSVTLTSGSDAVHYSTTGTADCSSTLVSGVIPVSVTTTISAIACDTAGNFSSAVPFTYTINTAATHFSGGYLPRAINLLALSGECKLGDLFSVITGKLCPNYSTSFIPSLQTPTLCPIYGSTQELVKEKTRGINAKGVQNAINQMKATAPPLVNDGVIGHLSEAGIKNAQKILLVTIDGIWGPKTQRAYELFIKKQCTNLYNNL